MMDNLCNEFHRNRVSIEDIIEHLDIAALMLRVEILVHLLLTHHREDLDCRHLQDLYSADPLIQAECNDGC